VRRKCYYQALGEKNINLVLELKDSIVKGSEVDLSNNASPAF
jgi:hypothetical protein